jgi:hypothetical protein
MNSLKHGECSALAIRARAERAAAMRDLRPVMAEMHRRFAAGVDLFCQREPLVEWGVLRHSIKREQMPQNSDDAAVNPEHVGDLKQDQKNAQPQPAQRE